MPALDRYVDHTIVHTGQNYDYELSQIFFDNLDIRTPDYFLEAAGTTAAEIDQAVNIVERVTARMLRVTGERLEAGA